MKKILIAGLGLFLASCQEKEADVKPVAPVAIWQEDDRFLFDARLQTNSYADGNSLYLMGLNNFTRLTQENGKNVSSRSLLERVNNPTQYKYPISKTLTAVAYDEVTVVVYPTHYPSIQSGKGILMTRIDPGFQAFDFASAATGECMALSNDNVLAVPYRATDGMKILLAKLQVTPSSTGLYDHVQVLDTKVVPLHPYHVPTQYVGKHPEGFYVANGEATYLLSPDGTLQKLRDSGLQRVFPYKQQVYGLFNDGLHASPDRKNWTFKADIETLKLLSYASLHDTLLLGTFNDQVFQIRIKPASINMLELKNDGLKGNKITSVSLYDHKVYVTTLSGVFVKDEKDFLSYKDAQ
ncbi:hypothetical protein [Rufibacter hautae]|uniref:DUF4221 domain-containing protein n=1 Tax=Rufibacter hautae TaxID=2595005 RepID=A0A5B6THA8_9BACT|nr:hypothetical protein [Rufibacter hautae]KAA3440064.1 hypothetical protein FOA19_05185 [Rufibacter hautae]